MSQGDERFKTPHQMAIGGEFLGLSENSLDGLTAFVQQQIEEGESYFRHPDNTSFDFDGANLSFDSPIITETPANNRAQCRVFESRRLGPALLVLPHWNSTANGYDSLGKAFSARGITTACLMLPYHGCRRSSDDPIAHGMVSANLGLTIRSCRQAVLEARLILDWLQQRGHGPIAVLGASLGTALASIVAAFDQRVRALALLSLAPDFAEIVWTGTAAQHIRQSLESSMTCQQLSEAWSIISPITYVPKLAARNIRVCAMAGKHDQVFQPMLAGRLIEAYRTYGIAHQIHWLPCGHYTLGEVPFNLVGFWRVLRFLKRELFASSSQSKSDGARASVGGPAPADDPDSAAA